jgi:phospholipid/cholesterol/gamma-HCH transport system ATP-binding protein
MSDRDANARGGAAAGAAEDDRDQLSRDDAASEAVSESADERARRAGDIIRRKQQQRARTAIQTELATDEVDRPRAEDPGPLQDAVIEMERVSLAFDRPILEDVSFAAFPGETLVIVGESGTGKSTALKLILRLLQPDEGRVYVCGQDIADLSFTEALAVRQKMGMVFQSAALFDSMTVFENVAYPLREHTDLTDDEIEARVREKLQFVDLDPEDVMEKLPAELSGGMKKRVGIARGMANNAEIMLYDEPTSGLDPLTTATITRLIMKLQRELNVTSVVVSHDIRSSFRMATHIALLADRSIRFFGTPEEMAASDDRYIRDFLGGF